MVTIEILRGEFLVISDCNPKLKIQLTNEEFDEKSNFELTKSQAKTLAAVLLVMAKQLD